MHLIGMAFRPCNKVERGSVPGEAKVALGIWRNTVSHRRIVQSQHGRQCRAQTRACAGRSISIISDWIDRISSTKEAP